MDGLPRFITEIKDKNDMIFMNIYFNIYFIIF